MSKMSTEYFTAIGGEFYTSPHELQQKLQTIKAFIFDWDGVFNDSSKTTTGSSYSEASSMGTNLVRFAYWWQHQHQLPIVAIITGENNQPAFLLAQREKFQAVYFKFANKQIAFEHFCQQYQLAPHEVAFVFDDVLDLPIVQQVGLRLMVRRKASPLFTQYVIQHKLVDYLTACEGQEHAVREICELLLALQGAFEIAVTKRTAFDADYQAYLQTRNAQQPKFFTLAEQQVVSSNPLA